MFGDWMEETLQTRRRKVPPPLTLLVYGWLGGVGTVALLLLCWWLAALANW